MPIGILEKKCPDEARKLETLARLEDGALGMGVGKKIGRGRKISNTIRIFFIGVFT